MDWIQIEDEIGNPGVGARSLRLQEGGQVFFAFEGLFPPAARKQQGARGAKQ